MKKQGGQLIILVVLLVALAAGYFGLARYNKGRQEQEANLVEGDVLVEIASDDILRFSYVYNGETYAFEKAEVPVESQEPGDADDTQLSGEAALQTESRWVSAADPSLNLMQNRLNAMAGKFTRIIAQNTITNVTDLSQYGLEEPSNILHWETAQEAYTYNVGDYNSFGNVYYICEPDSDTVYAVTTSLGTGFGYSLEDLVVEETEEAESGGAESPAE